MSIPKKVPVVYRGDYRGFPMYELAQLRTTRVNAEGATVELPTRDEPWFGDCVHTAGSGIAEQREVFERKTGQKWTLAEVACYFYSSPGMGCPDEVIDHEGAVYRIVPQDRIPAHCGVAPWMRRVMLDGTWELHCPAEMVRHWIAYWRSDEVAAAMGRVYESPQHLFPGVNANWKYRGTELIPLPDKTFTLAQYRSLAARIDANSERHDIPHLTQPTRLVGHEDLNPFPTAQRGRADKNGGWDPGARRSVVRFSWEILRKYLRDLKTAREPRQ